MQSNHEQPFLSDFSNLDPDRNAQKESNCLEEFCDNNRKVDTYDELVCGRSHKENGCNENFQAEAYASSELKMENEFREKFKNGKLEEEEKGNGVDYNQEEDEFEFPSILRNLESSPTPADEIFYNGQILPLYSVSGSYSELSRTEVAKAVDKMPPPPPETTVRHPLRLLFLEDRDAYSSSEADELDGVPPGIYCVWDPKKAAAEEGKCKKSNSNGSSKRLKFRNYLNRGSSEGGRIGVVFPSPPSSPPNETHSKKSHIRFIA